MNKIFKFLGTLFLISAAIAIGAFVIWAIAAVLVIRYLVKSKSKYTNLKDFFGEWKNIVATILAVILLVGAPVAFAKNMKEYKLEEKAKQEQQAILDKEKEEEDNKKAAQKERKDVLNAKSRLKKLKSDKKDYTKGITLTDSEIEKYDITDLEIEKFEDDINREIDALRIKDLAVKYRYEVKQYVRDNTDSSVKEVNQSRGKHSLNKDKTIFTYRGFYYGKNMYGTRIKCDIEVNFDVASGEIIDGFIGNEQVAE